MILDISNVLQVLTEVSDWQPLGIYLGLSHPTLQSIKSDNQNVSDCKLAMVAAWLKQQDKVSNPSWSALQEALRKTGEKTVADQIQSKQNFISDSY